MSSPFSEPRATSRRGRWLAALALLGVVVGVARSWHVSMHPWLSNPAAAVRALVGQAPRTEAPSTEEHDHAHAATEPQLALSPQAQRSIGLRVGPIALANYERTISVPGIVVERRGQAKIDLIAPLTGYVTRIDVTEGEAVSPDQPVCELRLTHDELVQGQAELLRTVEELDVVRRELTRLASVGEGVVPAKTILDRKYEQQKLEAAQRANRQALLLHGLSEAQVDAIIAERRLLNTIAVRVPPAVKRSAGEPVPLQVQTLKVERGQHVTAGESLALLADHSELLIEGEAFERDLPLIARAAQERTTLSALAELSASGSPSIDGLTIAYLASHIDPQSRTLHFYVPLPNRMVRDSREPGEPRFVEWQHKPGQRLQLRVPVERWSERIVLPSEAVAQDGVENYVFRINGDHFERQAVQVEYRDPQSVVIAADGALFVGEQIALTAAQQLLIAFKNQAAGPIDLHHGHSH